MDKDKWLEIVIEKIQLDLNDIKADLRMLLEEKARNEGKLYVVVGLITVAINLLAAWLKIN